jgi:predicted AlkP superfamily phosphohydrolase/phosphomutase
MGSLKRRSPAAMKKVYYKTLPPSATQKLARPTMMPAYAWANTRAFSLPTDQHGWIRINLRGREARGIVPPTEYQQTCEELEQLLRSLTTEDGRRLVGRLSRTAKDADDALSLSLPDLVVHWENAAFEPALEIKESAVRSPPIGTKFTGQHSLEGFCIVQGGEDLQKRDCVRATELGQAISRIFTNATPG